MKTTHLFAGAFLSLGVFLLTSCRNCPDSGGQKALQDSLNSYRGAFSQDEAFAKMFEGADDDGQEVLLSDARQCIALYKEEMKKRGVMEDGTGFRPPIVINDRMDITYAVKFNGFKFKEWMLRRYYGRTGEVHFKLAFGIYTPAFLSTYFPDNPSARQNRVNRITAFIIPYSTDSTKALRDDDFAYNLGGLEP